MSLGFSAYNVNQAQLEVVGNPEAIPNLIRAGLAYKASEQVFIVLDVVKDVDHPLSYRGGLEYKLNDILFARTGVSTEPLSMNLGLGLQWKEFQADFASSYTERLGYTPHISLAYRFTKKSQ